MSEDRENQTSQRVGRFIAGLQSRRQFLRRAGALSGVALAGGAVSSLLAACGGSSSVQQEAPTTASGGGSGSSTATAAATSGSGSSAATAAASPVGNVATGADVAERTIRKIIVLTEPQANVPQEFETTNQMVAAWKQLGIDAEMKVMPWEQMSDLVWYNRDKWDITAWQMVGRPERLDPDEFLYNLFHSSTAEKGYNFVGYNNPDYDAAATSQRVEMDRDKRKAIVYKCQEIINADQPYTFTVYPKQVYAYNKATWDETTIVDAKGIGIKNSWTFFSAAPKGSQKDMILNTLSPVQAINPLYISGGTDSWITELIWDRIMRIDADGLPKPWAAASVDWTDDTTVVCTMKSGMKWHDGQPVTVDDVVYSFTAPAGDMSPMYKPFVSSINEVKALDDTRVQFTLNAPNAAFETSGLSKINIIPKHVWEPVLKDLATKGENAEKYQEDTPIGSGPFKFVNWQRSAEIVLQANTDHFNAPKMNRWILRDVPNVSAAVGGLQSGELNFLSDYTGDPDLLKQTIDASKDLAMVATTVVGFRFMAPNERRAPMDDKAFRVALSTAADQTQILTNIFKGFAEIADSHVSKALEFWHDPNLNDFSKSDIAGAKKILADAGYEWDADGHLLYPKGKKETLKPES